MVRHGEDGGGWCGRLPAAAPPTLLKVEPGPGTPARVKTVARVQQPDLARGRGQHSTQYSTVQQPDLAWGRGTAQYTVQYCTVQAGAHTAA